MKTTRRTFMEKTLTALAALGFISWPPFITAKNQETMLVHQVYFWLKNPQDKQAHARLEAGLRSLLTISTIESGHLGTPAPTEARDVVDHSFSFSYNVRFKNVGDHDKYQNDPIHLKFIDDCAALWDRVKVYDYQVI